MDLLPEKDIYDTEGKLARCRARIGEGDFSAENKELLLGFLDNCFSEGLSQDRVLIYAQRLLPITKALGKDFKQVTEEDLRKYVSGLEQNNGLTDWSKHFHKCTLRKFFQWLYKSPKGEYPPLVSWISLRIKNTQRMLPEELLSQEELQKLIDGCLNPRDKAFIAVLAESGCRIGELLNIKLKHVSFDKHGAVIVVSGKTGARRIRLISSLNYLESWLEHHSSKSNPESFLWICLTHKRKGKQLNYADVRKMLLTAKARAHVEKRVNPHSFRHLRGTQLARLGLNESNMNSIMGWRQGSGMPRIYLHLSGADTDSALLGAYGLVKREDNNDLRIQCLRCKKENSPLNKFCIECGLPLNARAAVGFEKKEIELEALLKKFSDMLESGEIVVKSKKTS